MPHRSFEAARITEQREPITFNFGVYGTSTFTINPDPSLGDVLELDKLPELTDFNKTLPEVIRTLVTFIRRMLKAEDKAKFDEELFRIPSTQMFLIVECAEYIAEQVMPVPSQPPSSSSTGRPSGTETFKPS